MHMLGIAPKPVPLSSTCQLVKNKLTITLLARVWPKLAYWTMLFASLIDIYTANHRSCCKYMIWTTSSMKNKPVTIKWLLYLSCLMGVYGISFMVISDGCDIGETFRKTQGTVFTLSIKPEVCQMFPWRTREMPPFHFSLNSINSARPPSQKKHYMSGHENEVCQGLLVCSCWLYFTTSALPAAQVSWNTNKVEINTQPKWWTEWWNYNHSMPPCLLHLLESNLLWYLINLWPRTNLVLDYIQQYSCFTCIRSVGILSDQWRVVRARR